VVCAPVVYQGRFGTWDGGNPASPGRQDSSLGQGQGNTSGERASSYCGSGKGYMLGSKSCGNRETHSHTPVFPRTSTIPSPSLRGTLARDLQLQEVCHTCHWHGSCRERIPGTGLAECKRYADTPQPLNRHGTRLAGCKGRTTMVLCGILARSLQVHGMCQSDPPRQVPTAKTRCAPQADSPSGTRTSEIRL